MDFARLRQYAESAYGWVDGVILALDEIKDSVYDDLLVLIDDVEEKVQPQAAAPQEQTEPTNEEKADFIMEHVERIWKSAGVVMTDAEWDKVYEHWLNNVPLLDSYYQHYKNKG